MTDLMKLAEAYAWHSVHGAATNGESVIGAKDALQEAIEALQAENERLKSSLFTANRNNIRLVTAHLEQEEKTLAERDALQAKLDAMGKGEPVKYEYRDARDDGTWGAWVGCDKPVQPNTWRQVRELYAAPKALEPLTDDELWKFWWSRPEVPEGEDESMEAQFVAAARSILAAHGITKGTP